MSENSLKTFLVSTQDYGNVLEIRHTVCGKVKVWTEDEATASMDELAHWSLEHECAPLRVT